MGDLALRYSKKNLIRTDEDKKREKVTSRPGEGVLDRTFQTEHFHSFSMLVVMRVADGRKGFFCMPKGA